MKQKSLRIFLQAMIILTPLPFGCVSGVWSPLCFMLYAVFSFVTLLTQSAPIHFLYQRQMRWLGTIFLTMLVLQLLPLPSFLLKLLAPGTVRVLAMVSGVTPTFHSLSLIPAQSLLGLAHFLVYGMFFMALICLDWNKEDVFAVFRVAVFSGLLQFVIGLLKLWQGNSRFFLFFYPDSHLPDFLRGTIYNPDHFSFYLELLFPLALGLLFARLHIFDPGQSLRERILTIANERRVILLFLATLACASGIYLTGCRAGIAVLLLSTLFFAQMSVYLRVTLKARKNLRLIFTLATLLAVFVGLQSTFSKFVSGNYIQGGRVDYWANAMAIFRDFPLFGSGLSTFKYTYFLYGKEIKWVTHAHNEYLENLANMGLLAFLFFMALLFIMTLALLRMWNARHHPEIKPVVLGVLTSIFVAFFHSLFDFSLRIPANAFLFIMLLALGLKVVTYKREFSDEKK